MALIDNDKKWINKLKYNYTFMLTRRNFVKGIAAAGAASLVLPEQLFAMPTDKKIGIQLYSIHNLVNSDLNGSLEKLAGIGYNTIETAGYGDRKFYGHAPEAFRSLALGFGIEPLSSHSNVKLDNAEQTIDDAAAAGMKYVVKPSIPEDKRQTINDYRKLAEEFNEIGKLCKKAKLTFAYHNHAFEFAKIDGQIPYDVLLNNTDPDLVTMQMDTYWVFYGGHKPVDYIKKYPGRFKLWHVKDMAPGLKRESTEIGSGMIDFPAIFNLREESGMEYYFLEQEHFSMDHWESLAISFKYMNTLPQ